MLHLIHCNWAKGCGDWAPLVLRLAAGVVFLAHGFQKYQMGVAGVSGFLASLGFPAPDLMAALLIGGEIIGGSLLILGLYARTAAMVSVIIATVALLTVHISKGFFIANGGYEFILLLLAASVSVLITGAGRYSLDRKLKTGQE